MLGQNLNPVSIDDMFEAETCIRRFFPPSPLISHELLNKSLNAQVYLKLENLLPAGSYKNRGALNKISHLIAQYGKDIKIITASSGNHGIACALAASNLNVDCTIVVPTITPQIKKDCIRGFGAKILEVGETYDTSFIEACRISEEEKRYYVHPVADKNTVGGQGTISLELLQQLPCLDQIVVPLGGGGLITGISYAIKTIKPSVKVFGIMPEGSAVYVESRKFGKLVELERVSSMADAVVRKTGEAYLYPYIEKYVDDLFTVSEFSIKKGVKLAALSGKITLEGAGALALAALIEGRIKITKGTAVICSGGNIDQSVFEACLKIDG